jgi:hypothetical protein
VESAAIGPAVATNVAELAPAPIMTEAGAVRPGLLEAIATAVTEEAERVRLTVQEDFAPLCRDAGVHVSEESAIEAARPIEAERDMPP